eukprot:tig00021612_g22866.t1
MRPLPGLAVLCLLTLLCGRALASFRPDRIYNGGEHVPGSGTSAGRGLKEDSAADPHELADPDKHGHKILLHEEVLDTRWSGEQGAGEDAAGAAAAAMRRLLEAAEEAGDERHQTLLVHVSGPVTSEVRAEIEAAAGLQLGSYVPHNAFLASALPSQLQALRAAPHVAWVGRLEARHKRHPAHGASRALEWHAHLSTHWAAPAATAVSPAELAALWAHELAALCAGGVSLEAAHEGPAGPTVVARLGRPEDAPALAEFLADQPEVYWVQPRTRIELKNYYAGRLVQAGDFTLLTGAADIPTPVYARSLKGAGEVIGFIDDGLDYDSCFFANGAQQSPSDGSSAGKPDVTNRKVIAFRYNAKYGSAEGNTQHGTHTAATAVGQAYSGAGTEQIQQHAGVASDAKLTFISIKNKTDPTRLLTLQWDKAFAIHYADGARTHSNSWGCAPSTDNLAECNVYDQDALVSDMYMWNYTDALLVFAGGNDGSAGVATGKRGYISSPATAKNGISVGATMTAPQGWLDNAAFVASDYGCSAYPDWCATEKVTKTPGYYSPENLAGFSSSGPTWDGRAKPDVVAPGFFIVSAKSDNNPRSFNCALRSEAGTSMAAPVVSGAAALVRQYLREGWWPSGVRTAKDGIEAPQGALVKALIINGARPANGTVVHDFRRIATVSSSNPAVPILSSRLPIPNAYQGFGRVRLDTVLQFPESAFKMTFCDGYAPAVGAAAVVLTVALGPEARSTVPFRATLAWTDYPATPNAAVALVNNLDLSLVYNGRTYYPNGLSSADNVNNVEQIELPVGSPAATVTLRLSTRSLPKGPQPYSLVLTGRWTAVSGCARVLSVPASSLPTGSLTAPLPSPLPSADSELVVMATLTLTLDLARWPAHVDEFRRAVAQQLRVAYARVVVEAVAAGSTRVTFYVSNPEYPTEAATLQALSLLASLNTGINLGPNLVATALSFAVAKPTVFPDPYVVAGSAAVTPTPLPATGGGGGFGEMEIVAVSAASAGAVVLASAVLIVWMAVRWSRHAIRRAVVPAGSASPAAVSPAPGEAPAGSVPPAGFQLPSRAALSRVASSTSLAPPRPERDADAPRSSLPLPGAPRPPERVPEEKAGEEGGETEPPPPPPVGLVEAVKTSAGSELSNGLLVKPEAGAPEAEAASDSSASPAPEAASPPTPTAPPARGGGRAAQAPAAGNASRRSLDRHAPMSDNGNLILRSGAQEASSPRAAGLGSMRGGAVAPEAGEERAAAPAAPPARLAARGAGVLSTLSRTFKAALAGSRPEILPRILSLHSEQAALKALERAIDSFGGADDDDEADAARAAPAPAAPAGPPPPPPAPSLSSRPLPRR